MTIISPENWALTLRVKIPLLKYICIYGAYKYKKSLVKQSLIIGKSSISCFQMEISQVAMYGAVFVLWT